MAAATRAWFSQLRLSSTAMKWWSGHLGRWHLTASDTAGFYMLYCSLPKWPSLSLHRPGICATAKATEPQYMNRDYIVMWGQQCVRFLIKSQCQGSQLSACCRHSHGVLLFSCSTLADSHTRVFSSSSSLFTCYCQRCVFATDLLALFSAWTFRWKLVHTLSLYLALSLPVSHAHAHSVGVFPQCPQTNPWHCVVTLRSRRHPTCVVSPTGHYEVYRAGSSITSAILITIMLWCPVVGFNRVQRRSGFAAASPGRSLADQYLRPMREAVGQWGGGLVGDILQQLQ